MGSRTGEIQRCSSSKGMVVLHGKGNILETKVPAEKSLRGQESFRGALEVEEKLGEVG